MSKAIRVVLVGVAYFVALLMFIPILTYIKAWLLGIPFDLSVVMPIALKFALYGAGVVALLLALGAKVQRKNRK